MRKQSVWVALAAVLCGLVAVVPGATSARSVHFVAAGDFGARAATRTVLDGMAAANASAALALGDLAYQDIGPETAWCAYVKQSFGQGFPFQLVAGNHESSDVQDGAINNYSSCLPNQVPGVAGTYGREYYMDFPRTDPLVRVIAVSPQLTFEDGKWAYNVGDAHYQWLSDAIDAGRAAGAKWIVVAAHIPCWSVGTYTCQSVDFYNLLLAKKVDLVLSGHEHGYARTHQLASGLPGCATVPVGSFDADCVRDSDNAFTAGQGTVLATVGTGGIPLRTVNPADTEAGYFASYAGSNSNPAYGFLDFTVDEESLVSRFITTSGASFTDAFTITRSAGNVPPAASFTSSASGLTVSVDGSGSSDPDGGIATYTWDFGDGGPTATGPTATRTYASAGTYTITLTVADTAGATASTSSTVTVTAPGGPLAADTFTRTSNGGWGAADTGGSYTHIGTATNYAVNGTTGTITIPPGASRRSLLPSVSSSATDLTATIGHTGTLTGGGLYVSLMPRVMPDTSSYRAKLRIYATGTARISLVRATSAGAETTLATATTTLTGMSNTRRIVIRTEASGTSPTTLRAKIWYDGTAEPATWAVQATDATSALQAPGAVGVFAYQSSTATSAATFLTDNLRAEPM